MNIDQAIKNLVEVRQEMKRLKQIEDEAKAVLKELPLNEKQVSSDGQYIVSLSEVSRFNETEASRNLDPERLESISKMKPDSQLAKAILDEETYRIACCTQSVTVNVKAVND